MMSAACGFFDYFYTKGLFRHVGDELAMALSSDGTAGEIDIELAKGQHHQYIKTLLNCGVSLVGLPSDPTLPDGVFVEDICVMLPDVAVITHPGSLSRRREVPSIRDAFLKIVEIVEMTEAGTLDGGDVLRLGKEYLVGLSSRTDDAGAKEFIEIVKRHGCHGAVVPVPRGLHLKTGVTPLDGETVVGVETMMHLDPLKDKKKIIVPPEEAPAGNVLSVNGTVIVPEGFPGTRSLIEDAGFETVEVENGEFVKADGGLTCRSVLW
jgi:dimethylargininase